MEKISILEMKKGQDKTQVKVPIELFLKKLSRDLYLIHSSSTYFIREIESYLTLFDSELPN